MTAKLLIIATSGRSLAQAATCSGYSPVVIDFFGDEETASLCIDHAILDRHGGYSVTARALAPLLAEIDQRHGCLPVVWGSGFEAHPELLIALRTRREVHGSNPEALFAAENPDYLSRIVRNAGALMPRLTYIDDAPSAPCVAKRRGSAGGFDVRSPRERHIPGQREYLQRRINGTSLSLLLISSVDGVDLIGVHEHITLQDFSSARHRFSGLIEAPKWRPAIDTDFISSLARVSEAIGVRGIFGVDVIATNDNLYIVDLNPRPTAALELYANAGSLLQHHIEGGRVAVEFKSDRQLRGLGVVYADQALHAPSPQMWPSWVSDRPRFNQRIGKGEPICTIGATGTSTTEVESALRKRKLHVEENLA